MSYMVWLQRELRLQDSPILQQALQKSAANDEPVIVAYFHDENRQVGAANSAWLAKSLLKLQQRLSEKGGHLWLIEGDFSQRLSQLIKSHNIKELFYAYQVGEPFQSQQQLALQICQKHEVTMQPSFSEFLFEPEQLLNQQQKPYLVFTPFYKNLLRQRFVMQPLTDEVEGYGACGKISPPAEHSTLPEKLNQLYKTPPDNPWADKVMSHWTPGEQGAWQRFEDFIANDIADYNDYRDFPALEGTSALSAHLHFGEINMRSLYFRLLTASEKGEVSEQVSMQWFRQLAWREFARHLLHWFPQLEEQPFQIKYQAMQWPENLGFQRAWQQGKTGIPIIDAGMRQLWQTGTMHNRVRMLVASLLTKNLNQHWLVGKHWFDETLVDADPANNIMGWQWVAGCGVDAAPYYRLFNPVTQSKKFDELGQYLRHWLPELRVLSSKAIHEPWDHPVECQMKGIQLGEHYPLPIVDLKLSRQQHMERVALLKSVKM